jgi:hypothetical protein
VKEHEEQAGREARDVAIELKKAHDEKEKAVTVAKAESSEQLTARAREVKTLSKHIENLKLELEQTKDREKSASQAKLDEVWLAGYLAVFKICQLVAAVCGQSKLAIGQVLKALLMLLFQVQQVNPYRSACRQLQQLLRPTKS